MVSIYDYSVKRSAVVLLTIVYLILLHIDYVIGVAPRNSYLGYIYMSNSFSQIVLSWFIAILPAFWMPIKYTRPSQLIYWFLYLIVVIPSIVMPVYIGRFDLCLKQGLLIVVAFLLLNFIFIFPLISIPKIKISYSVFLLVILSISLINIVYIFYVFGVSKSLTWIFSPRVYDIRLNARSIMAPLSRIGRYIITWQSQVFGPFLFASGLYRHNWLLIVFGVISQIIIYSVLATKNSIFSLLLACVIFFLLDKFSNKSLGIYLLLGAVVGVFCVILVDYIFTPTTWFLSSTITRRVIYTPGLLTTYFFDFFSKKQPALLGHSFLKNITKYPYDISPTFLIGLHYFGNISTNADANLWADGYANFGIAGVFMFTIVLAIVLWLLDNLSKPLGKEFAGLIGAFPGYILADSPLFTSLLTHGVLILLIIVWFIPREFCLRKENQGNE